MAKCKTKVVEIDKELSKRAADYPKVMRAPQGYPELIGVPGKTWYERAHNYERIYKKKVLPVEPAESKEDLNKETK